MKLSLVITIFNEESTLDSLLTSLQQQTLAADEVIIIDGGSKDGSLKIVKEWQKKPYFKNKLKFLTKKGNRSVGRNFGIKKSKNKWIAITDAGCIPDKNWLKELFLEQKKSEALVIAGYYFGITKSSFEEAVVPYVLVMPNKIDENNFLPATRSMLIEKNTWKKLGGFDEKLNHNEDYDFAKKIEKENIKKSFTKKALVGWLPRKNLISFFIMILRFSFGDAEANILRPKVLLIIARYTIAIILGLIIYLSFISEFFQFFKIYGFITLLISFFIYCFWAVMKNKKYTPTGWLWLPILQVSSDIAVIIGTISGSMKKTIL
jgi:glycosyltransferase involved in cell wall biosynthesis